MEKPRTVKAPGLYVPFYRRLFAVKQINQIFAPRRSIFDNASSFAVGQAVEGRSLWQNADDSNIRIAAFGVDDRSFVAYGNADVSMQQRRLLTNHSDPVGLVGDVEDFAVLLQEGKYPDSVKQLVAGYLCIKANIASKNCIRHCKLLVVERNDNCLCDNYYHMDSDVRILQHNHNNYSIDIGVNRQLPYNSYR